MEEDRFELLYAGLYTAYFFSNVFLPFITGGIRDLLGDRFTIIMLGFLLILG